MASTTTVLETIKYFQHEVSTTPILLHSSDMRPTPTLTMFEKLPVEIIDQILSYLVHPRCRLPGLSEAQSSHDIPEKTKRSIKDQEDLTRPPDRDRWATDIFSLHVVPHPFNALARTSKRCHEHVENYCSHLTIDEVSRQYHVSSDTILNSKHIRGNASALWVLRIDVEALALQLYRTRAFHEARKEQFGRPCSICAITRFNLRQIAKKRAPKRLLRN
ncbi:hypothetical protein A1F96_05655 [Pyrenophora tritici-repentis]|nr:hypothetical protein A1F96_05655 [Pyrenophora tritici-repentis]